MGKHRVDVDACNGQVFIFKRWHPSGSLSTMQLTRKEARRVLAQLEEKLNDGNDRN